MPVFIAIVIALPAGYWLMTNWLQGYTYRIELSPWTFVIAPLAALAVAWLTVSVQTYLVARQAGEGAQVRIAAAGKA